MPRRQCWCIAQFVTKKGEKLPASHLSGAFGARISNGPGVHRADAAADAAPSRAPADPLGRSGDQSELDSRTLVSGHLAIESTGGEQLFVGAALDDAALIQDEDLVAMDNAAQTVRDQDDRPLPLEALQRFRNQPLVQCIQGARGFIEHEEGSFGQ